MFFLMRDWERDMVDPCLLAREIEVALDIEAVSFILGVDESADIRGSVCVLISHPCPFDVTERNQGGNGRSLLR